MPPLRSGRWTRKATKPPSTCTECSPPCIRLTNIMPQEFVALHTRLRSPTKASRADGHRTSPRDAIQQSVITLLPIFCHNSSTQLRPPPSPNADPRQPPPPRKHFVMKIFNLLLKYAITILHREHCNHRGMNGCTARRSNHANDMAS